MKSSEVGKDFTKFEGITYNPDLIENNNKME